VFDKKKIYHLTRTARFMDLARRNPKGGQLRSQIFYQILTTTEGAARCSCMQVQSELKEASLTS